ncbi:hypothetical protein MtrunA17_Chr3g0125771 [Medicago truncatula]|uniref:Uncharacterized protein n=1 Tax=Medicago truncatula TaxID=3880 RepID=A0A072V078_MEDTR|nr:hypothetical protein MTR_3g089015 [Medicago truncatula]RHN69536.1 hypothetical protein MtrunA17_Chr3g0125771 [Medicago truncatula]
MIELRICDEVPVRLKIDNKSAINLVKNPICHGKIKHIETSSIFLRIKSIRTS